MIVGCSWCHAAVDLGPYAAGAPPTTCATCGHRADLPRAACDCLQCRQYVELTAVASVGPIVTVPIAGLRAIGPITIRGVWDEPVRHPLEDLVETALAHGDPIDDRLAALVDVLYDLRVVDAAAYTCPHCGAVSHNPHDRAHQYCGRCHRFEQP